MSENKQTNLEAAPRSSEFKELKSNPLASYKPGDRFRAKDLQGVWINLEVVNFPGIDNLDNFQYYDLDHQYNIRSDQLDLNNIHPVEFASVERALDELPLLAEHSDNLDSLMVILHAMKDSAVQPHDLSFVYIQTKWASIFGRFDEIINSVSGMDGRQLEAAINSPDKIGNDLKFQTKWFSRQFELRPALRKLISEALTKQSAILSSPIGSEIQVSVLGTKLVLIKDQSGNFEQLNESDKSRSGVFYSLEQIRRAAALRADDCLVFEQAGTSVARAEKSDDEQQAIQLERVKLNFLAHIEPAKGVIMLDNGHAFGKKQDGNFVRLHAVAGSKPTVKTADEMALLIKDRLGLGSAPKIFANYEDYELENKRVLIKDCADRLKAKAQIAGEAAFYELSNYCEELNLNGIQPAEVGLSFWKTWAEFQGLISDLKFQVKRINNSTKETSQLRKMFNDDISPHLTSITQSKNGWRGVVGKIIGIPKWQLAEWGIDMGQAVKQIDYTVRIPKSELNPEHKLPSHYNLEQLLDGVPFSKNHEFISLETDQSGIDINGIKIRFGRDDVAEKYKQNRSFWGYQPLSRQISNQARLLEQIRKQGSIELTLQDDGEFTPMYNTNTRLFAAHQVELRPKDIPVYLRLPNGKVYETNLADAIRAAEGLRKK